MKRARGDMWSVFGKCDLFMIPTNPIVNSRGLAVMGRGLAAQAAERFPELRARFGRFLQEEWMGEPVGVIGRFSGQRVGFFHTKRHWKFPASLSCVKEGVDMLNLLSWGKSWNIHLAYPGIGNGKLKEEHVAPIVELLPDNVTVWTYE